MREVTPFGVVLIRNGHETGPAAEPESVGTLAGIVDFDQGEDGLLHIDAVGHRRFRIKSREVEPSTLQVAEIILLPEEPRVAVPTKHQRMVDVLRDICDRLKPPLSDAPRQFEDAAWVGHRLAEILPLQPSEKQELLEMQDPLNRLDRITALIESL